MSHAKESLHGVQRLHKILQEIDKQPQWRLDADRCFQYYDGNQLPADVIATLEARGLPVLINNLIQPTINGVLGMEARSRTDWVVRADDDEFKEVAEGLNMRVNEALRTAKANMATSEAYKSQVIAGIGWVEVKPNRDPLGAKYSINEIHRDEIFYDWRTSPDLHDCRWIMRARWVDKDEAKSFFPQHKEIIEQSIRQWSDWDMTQYDRSGPLLSRAYDEFQYSQRNPLEWIHEGRDMIKVYELYYRTWESSIVIRDERGNAAEFNESNPIHIALINSQRVTVEKRPVPKMRLSWYVGVHHIVDMPSPHPHNHYPYVPFIGVQEDKTKRPYGLVRSMLSPQDEVNYRRIRLTANLNYKRIVMDADATLMSDEDLRHEVNSMAGIIKTNPNAKRANAHNFRVEVDQGIAQQQFQIMQEAKAAIQDVAGVYNAYLGKNSNAQSGIAINSLVEQGSTTLADLNDNYRFSRQKVGELVLAYEVAELRDKDNVSIFVPSQPGQKAREIILNQRDDNGKEITNSVAKAKTQVVVSEDYQTPGYRAQVSKMLLDFVGQLPEAIQLASIDLIIEQMDLPEDKKARLLKAVQKVNGEVVTDDMSEDELADYEQQMQQAQAEEQQAREIQQTAMQLELEERQARVQKQTAEASLTQQRAGTEQMKKVALEQLVRQRSATPPPLPSGAESRF